MRRLGWILAALVTGPAWATTPPPTVPVTLMWRGQADVTIGGTPTLSLKLSAPIRITDDDGSYWVVPSYWTTYHVTDTNGTQILDLIPNKAGSSGYSISPSGTFYDYQWRDNVGSYRGKVQLTCCTATEFGENAIDTTSLSVANYVDKGGDTMTGRLVLQDAAQFQAQSATPTSPISGTVYYDSDDSNLFVYDGTSWIDLTVQGIGAGDVLAGQGISVGVEGTSVRVTNTGVRSIQGTAGIAVGGVADADQTGDSVTVSPTYGPVGDITGVDATAAAAGTTDRIARSDHRHQLGAHGTTHDPGGADAVTTGAPSALGTAASEGTASALARQDHVHPGPDAGLWGDTGTTTTIIIGEGTGLDLVQEVAGGTRIITPSADIGTGAGQVAAGSHAGQHLPAGADPLTTASVTGTWSASSAGTAESFPRSDHVHQTQVLVRDEGAGQGAGHTVDVVGSEISLAVAAGVATITHDSSGSRTPTAHAASHLPGAADGLSTANVTGTSSANAEGTAASFARSDHEHATQVTGIDEGSSLGPAHSVQAVGAELTATLAGGILTLTHDDSPARTPTAHGPTHQPNASDSISDTYVVTNRQVLPGTGMTGGGDLSADRIITLADTTVTPGSVGGAGQSATLTIDQQGRATAASNTAISHDSIADVSTSDHHVKTAAADLEDGGSDEMSVSGLAGLLDDTQTITTSVDGASSTRTQSIDYVGGSNVTLAQSAVGDTVTMTITATGEVTSVTAGDGLVNSGTAAAPILDVQVVAPLVLDSDSVSPTYETDTGLTVSSMGRLAIDSRRVTPSWGNIQGTPSLVETITAGAGLTDSGTAADPILDVSVLSPLVIDSDTVSPRYETDTGLTVSSMGGLAIDSRRLTPSYGNLTGVPATFAPTAHAADHMDSVTDPLLARGHLLWTTTGVSPRIDTSSGLIEAGGHLAVDSSRITPTRANVQDFAHNTTHETAGGDAITATSLDGTSATPGATTIPIAEGDGNLAGGWIDPADLQDGGVVEITVGGLNGLLADTQTITTRVDGAGDTATGILDLVGGTGIDMTTGVAGATRTVTPTLSDTLVTPGSYTLTDITVDQQGRITAASSGTAAAFSGDVGDTTQGELDNTADGYVHVNDPLAVTGNASVTGVLTVRDVTNGSGMVVDRAGVNDVVTITGGTLASAKTGLTVTGTMNAAAATQDGVVVTITGAGTDANQHTGAHVTLAAGFTGAGRSTALRGSNGSAGTGTGLWSVGAYNTGVFGQASGVSAGHNSGASYDVAGSSSLNVGSFSTAGFYGGGGNNAIGVVGHADASEAGAATGGFFTIQNSNTPTAPTLPTECALMADNRDAARDIFVARDNGTKVLAVEDGGVLRVSPGGTDNVIIDTSNTTITQPIEYGGSETAGTVVLVAGTATVTHNLGMDSPTTSYMVFVTAQADPGVDLHVVQRLNDFDIIATNDVRVNWMIIIN